VGSALNWDGIICRLEENAGKITHGEVAVTLKVHEKRIVRITYATTETVKEPGETITSGITENQQKTLGGENGQPGPKNGPSQTTIQTG
jgi:hypothetical protein